MITKKMENNIKYQQAKKRVKQIKGFYIHALVYILVNAFIMIMRFQKHGNIDYDNWGIGLWAVGLAVHGLSVFLPNFILGKNWEEKKIRELMNKQK